MSTDVVPVARTEAELTELATLLGLDPRQPKTKAMVMVAARYGLDPLLRHIVIIPGSGPYVTRDGLLHVAHQSGVFDGIELVDGPRLEDRQWVATIRVWRKDWSHAVTYPGRYPSTGQNSKYGPEMAVKVAECMALRRAFDIAGMPVLEEKHIGDEIGGTFADSAYGDDIEPAIAGGSDTNDPELITPAQRKKLWAQLKRADMENQDIAKQWMTSLLGVDVASTNQLTQAQVSILLDELKLLIGRGADRTRPPARDDGGEASPAPDQWTVDPQTGELHDVAQLEIVDDEK